MSLSIGSPMVNTKMPIRGPAGVHGRYNAVADENYRRARERMAPVARAIIVNVTQCGAGA